MTAAALPSDAPFSVVPLSFAAYVAALGFLPCSDLGAGGLAAGNASPAASNQVSRCPKCLSYGYCYFPDRCGRTEVTPGASNQTRRRRP